MIRKILCATAASLLAASTLHSSAINIAVQCHNGAPCDFHAATLILQSTSDKSVVRRVSLNSPHFQITEQPGSQWDLHVEAHGLWALPSQLVFPKDNQGQYSLTVFRTGTIQGQVKVSDPAVTPAVKIVVASRPEPRIPPEIPRGTSFDCSTAKTGAWKCTLPATLLDIAVRVEGYAPYHKWDVKIPPAGVLDLGVLKLHKGASLVAWLDSEFCKRVDVPVRAVLRYEAMGAPSLTSMRLALPVAEGVFTKKGVVQLAPITAGRYVLEVQAKGFASTRVPVELYQGRETTPRRSIELLLCCVIQMPSYRGACERVRLC